MRKIHKPKGGRIHELDALVDYDRPYPEALVRGSCKEIEDANHLLEGIQGLLPQENKAGVWKYRLVFVNFGDEKHSVAGAKTWIAQNALVGADVRTGLELPKSVPDLNEAINMYSASIQLPELFDLGVKSAVVGRRHYFWVSYVGDSEAASQFWLSSEDERELNSDTEAWYLAFDPKESMPVGPDFKLPD